MPAEVSGWGITTDALGEEVRKEVAGSQKPTEEQGPFSEEKVWDAMRGCYDPEIPVNIVDLGLIYDCRIEEGESGKKIAVKMTLPAQGCGMGPVIADDAKPTDSSLARGGVGPSRYRLGSLGTPE